MGGVDDCGSPPSKRLKLLAHIFAEEPSPSLLSYNPSMARSIYHTDSFSSSSSSSLVRSNSSLGLASAGHDQSSGHYPASAPPDFAAMASAYDGHNNSNSMASVYDAMAAARSTLYHSPLLNMSNNPYASLPNSGITIYMIMYDYI